MLHTVFISVNPCANMCKQVQSSTIKYNQVQSSTDRFKQFHTGIYWYILVQKNCKRMYNYRIQTNDLMHTILLIQLLYYKHEPTSVTVCFCMLHIHVCQHCCSVLPCSWCRTSCAGPATTPMPAMGRRPGARPPRMDSTISQ